MNNYLQEKLDLLKNFQARVNRQVEQFEYGNQSVEDCIYSLGEIMQDVGYDLQHGGLTAEGEHWEDETPAELKDAVLSLKEDK